MRYLNTRDNKFDKRKFVTGFQIDRKYNLIKVYYADNTFIYADYSEDNVIKLEGIMKKQVIDAYKNIGNLKRGIKSETLWELYNIWFMFYDISNMISSDENGRKITFGVCGAGFLGLFIARLLRIEDMSGIVKELNKYKFFIENEKIINYEAEQFYTNENANSIALDAPAKLTINDLSQMSIKELEETVELIEQAHEDVDFNALKMELK